MHFFEDEEAAYFYLFGVLAAEAIRSGRPQPYQVKRVRQRIPRADGDHAAAASRENVSKVLTAQEATQIPIWSGYR